MKIGAIRIHGFGRLTGAAYEGLSSKVVVFGPNESGKSTMREFVRNLLFGFRPASRESHPYAPWDDSPMGGELEIELKKGERIVLERRLLTTVRGAIRSSSGKSALANRPLPAAARVGRKVFESIYTLSREDLEFPEERWDEVRDRLVGGSGLEKIRSAREVAEELEREGKSLWREDGRGKSRCRVLDEEIRGLGKSIREARARDEKIRRFRWEMEQLREERREKRLVKEETGARLERLALLEEGRSIVGAILRDEREAGDLAPFDGVPDDPATFFSEREKWIDDLEEERERKRGERKRAEKEREALTEELARVLEMEGAIEGAIEGARGLGRDREDLRALGRKEEASRVELREKARRILAEPEKAPDLEIPPAAEIFARVDRFRSRREERRTADAALRALSGPSEAPRTAWPLALIAAGAAGALLFFLLGRPIGWVFGGAGLLALFAALDLLLAARRGAAGTTHAARVRLRQEKDAKKAAAAEEEALAAVRAALAPVPLLPVLLEEPNQRLARALDEFGRALATGRQITEERHALEEELRRVEEKVIGVAREVGLEGRDAPAVLSRLERLLREAREAGRGKERAEQAIRTLEEEIPPLEEKLGKARAERDEIERLVLSVGAGEREACIARLHARRRAAARAEEARERLAREGRDFEAFRARIAEAEKREEGAGEKGVPDETKARLEEEGRELEEALVGLEGRISERKSDLRHLERERPAAEIEGEKAAALDEREEIRRARDRYALLAALVRTGDSRYREEHEPDIFRRAGAYISAVTGGRYGRLLLPEDGEGGLEVVAPGASGPVAAASPLSRGTLDQLFLSFRLALVDHLEGDGESLPLFLDETMAHWDEERIGRGLRILEEIAARRQLFFFTCHRPLRDRMVRMGAEAIDLPAPASEEKGERGRLSLRGGGA